MLKHLYIRNFVLIDELEVHFDRGLSVITGETGAGKSILFGALSLLKGKRADLAELKDQSSKAIIEARIDVSKYRMRNAFESEDLDYHEEAIFRRELSPQGSSRAFINDTPVRLDQMQKLGDLLFDIHSQHQSIQLNDLDFRLDLIDELSEAKKDIQAYRELYADYKLKEKRLEELREKSRLAIQEQDYLQFQFDELNELQIKEGEEQVLEEEHSLLGNGEQIIGLADEISALMDSEESSSISNLHLAAQKLDDFVRLNPSMKEMAERFRSAYLELRDIHNEIEAFKDDFDFDEKRLNFIEERMADLHRMKHKHGYDSADELIPFIAELEQKLLSIGGYSEEINLLEGQLEQQGEELSLKAKQISEKRVAYFPQLEESVMSSLKGLGIPNAQFKVNREEVQLGKNGIDKIEFFFSANKGKELQDVKKNASGGELSRIMLSLKREMAGKKQMPALFFDEIDTGVSGEVADQLGGILKEMGARHQIISITHLPQLAAKGNTHFYVYKKEEEGLTRTSIKKLSETERVDELAKMLSGEKVSEAAINNAKELLAQ